MMNSPCKIEKRPAQPIASVRARTPVTGLATVLGPLYGKVMAYVEREGAAPTGAPFVAYHNMDMADLDIEAGFPVDRVLPNHGDITGSELPAGDYATCLHVGPYDQMGPVYAALEAYIQQQGRAPSGVAYEFYFNSPEEVAPEQLQTQVMFPLL